MRTTARARKISDLTVGELQDIIRNTIHEFIDPDYGLKLQPGIEKELKESRKQKSTNAGIPLKEARKRLGLT